MCGISKTIKIPADVEVYVVTKSYDHNVPGRITDRTTLSQQRFLE